MKDKLKNLLNFKEYDKLSDDRQPTKRTDIGGDILKEHHMFDYEEIGPLYSDNQRGYIMDNLDFISDDLVNTIYDLIEEELL